MASLGALVYEGASTVLQYAFCTYKWYFV